ncbi:M48 family metallopeptidase [Rouxiella badensis]|nr:M48 family metallopeptidase [Rouxiella badensis]QII38106.1 M48 family metallopeptidase [Rouxiella badensis]
MRLKLKLSTMATRFVTTGLLVSTLSASLLPLCATADSADLLPDMGTTAGGTLTIDQELQMGDYYVRQLRGSAPLITDPLLDQYVNQLGNRLVAHAYSVRFPFHFFIVNNDELNAFAFFGGNVVLHSAIFRFTDNESELASVLSHEISHVTQRHLARAMEDQKSKSPLTWVGVLGSILLAMASPEAGMAGLTGTIAGTQQGMISFTRANEEEADRIGLQVLQRSGFDPEAMPNFLQKLADQSRYASKPPEMLLTHPLPDSRLSDARNRANQMPRIVVQSSEDFYFAKVRILGMYGTEDHPLTDDYLKQLSDGNIRQQSAAQYGRAVQFYKAKSFNQARNILEPMLKKEPGNAWYLDLLTDIDIDQKHVPQAIARLEKADAATSKDAVLQLNIANAYIEGGELAKASRLLYRYTYAHPDDVNGWDLLTKSVAEQGLRAQELAARAESMALVGRLDKSISMLSSASAQSKLGSLDQARYDARIDQLRQLQKRFQLYEKG